MKGELSHPSPPSPAGPLVPIDELGTQQAASQSQSLEGGLGLGHSSLTVNWETACFVDCKCRLLALIFIMTSVRCLS